MVVYINFSHTKRDYIKNTVIKLLFVSHKDFTLNIAEHVYVYYKHSECK